MYRTEKSHNNMKLLDFFISVFCFVLVQFIVIINDLDEYVHMRHLNEKKDYLRFSFILSIFYFIGVSLIFQFHKDKYIILGVLIITLTAYNNSLFKNGYITPSNDPIVDVDFVLFTTPSAQCRRNEFFKRWKLPHPLHSYYGLEGPKHFENVKNHPVLYEYLTTKLNIHAQRNNNSYNLAMGLKQGLLNNFTLPRPTKKWIFVFEDDAVLNPRFQQLLQPALEYYKDYDLIWGDVATHMDYIYKNTLTACTSGMIYNQKSMKKIAKIFDFERIEFKEMLKHWPLDGTPPYVIDRVIGYNCNRGFLKCGYVPLTHEANDWSSSIGKIALKY